MSIAHIDVVVVSYNSADHLRGCVEPFAGKDDFAVFVVDNASTDGTLSAVRDLALTTTRLEANHGFAYGNNVALPQGTSDFVLFLNPDARISPEDVRHLARVLESSNRIGAAGPRIVDADGALDFSQRRYPRLRSTFARAFFLHRVFPNASWVDDLVRDRSAYQSPRDSEWLSGACILARRDVLERVGGWDEGFFLYGEDIDLCARIWNAGFEVRFDPSAEALHLGGASADRSGLAPVLAESLIRYAHKHGRGLTPLFVRLGLGLEAITRILVGRGGLSARVGHARALWTVCSPLRDRQAVAH